MHLDTDVKKDDMVYLGNNKKVKMSLITQKELYEDAILKKTMDHAHQSKWVQKLDIVIFWEEVWNAVHNFLLSNKIRTEIWEQIHLNFYTQYSYNKWHGTLPPVQKYPRQHLPHYYIVNLLTIFGHKWNLYYTSFTGNP